MYKTLEITIQGIAPLLLHNSQLSNPLNLVVKEIKKVSSKRGKTDEDHALMMQLEWLGSLYTTKPFGFEIQNHQVTILEESGVKPCIPGENIEATLIAGAKKNKLGTQFKSGVICNGLFPLIFDGPSTISGLWSDGRFADTRSARVQQARVMRTRPIFHDWKLQFSLEYLPSSLDEAQVYEALKIAGQIIGIGDQRPKFGRFEILN